MCTHSSSILQMSTVYLVGQLHTIDRPIFFVNAHPSIVTSLTGARVHRLIYIFAAVHICIFWGAAAEITPGGIYTGPPMLTGF